MSRLQTFQYSLLSAGSVQVVTVIANLLLIPLLIGEFGLKEWGTWLALTGMYSLFLVFDFGLLTGLLVRITRNCSSFQERQYHEYMTIALIFTLVFGLLVILSGVTVYDFLLDYVDENANKALYQAAFTLSCVTIPLVNYYNFLYGLSSFRLNNRSPSLIILVGTVLNYSFQLIFVTLDFGFIALTAPQLLVAFLTCFLFLQSRAAIPKFRIVRPSGAILLEALFIVRNVGVIKLSEKLIKGITPTVIGANSGGEFVALFTIFKKSSDICLRLINILRSAILMPLLNSDVNATTEKNRSLFGVWVGAIYANIAFFGAGILIWNETFVYLWTGITSDLSTPLTVVILAYTVAELTRSMNQDFIIFKGKERSILPATLVLLCLDSIALGLYQYFDFFIFYCSLVAFNIIYCVVLVTKVSKYYADIIVRPFLPPFLVHLFLAILIFALVTIDIGIKHSAAILFLVLLIAVYYLKEGLGRLND